MPHHQQTPIHNSTHFSLSVSPTTSKRPSWYRVKPNLSRFWRPFDTHIITFLDRKLGE